MHRRATAGRHRRGLPRQRLRRRCEREARRSAVAFARWCRRRGLDPASIYGRLTLRGETLRRWEQRWRRDRLDITPLGRAPEHGDRELRQNVLALFGLMGPELGLPFLQEKFPEAARAELLELRDYARHRYKRRRRWLVHVLRWTRPGAVWAMDFTQPPAPIDVSYGRIFCVRDLASGYQLQALPCPGEGTGVVLAALEALVRVWGAPLAIKCDNGGAFRSAAVRAWAERHGVLLLFSPAGLPSYNGSIEAGIGSIKTRAHYEAARQGRVGEWTCDDVDAAAEQANETARPQGRDGPSPRELWQQRWPIAPLERQRLRASYRRHYATECNLRGWSWSSELQHPERSSIDRVAITRALLDHGFLLFRRRRIALPIRKSRARKIS